MEKIDNAFHLLIERDKGEDRESIFSLQDWDEAQNS